MLNNDRSFSAEILQTIGVALLAIDRDLKVFVANEAFLRQFNVRREDTVGCCLFDLGNRQWDIPELRTLLDKAFQHNGFIENYRVEQTFESIGRRVMLLNARRIQTPEAGEGLLLAIADDTERDRLQFELEGRIEFADKLIDSVREALLVLHWDLRVHSANQPFFDLFKVDRDKTVGRLVYELGNGQWDIPELRVLLEDILPKAEAFDDYEVRHTFEAIGTRVMLLNGRRLDHLNLIVLAIRDVTNQRADEGRRRERDRRREYTLTLSQTLADLSDSREIQETACRLLGRILDVASAQYSVLDPLRHAIVVAHDGYRESMPSLVGEYPIANYPAHAAALQAGRPLAIDDVETSPLLSEREREELLGLSIRAALSAPVTRDRPASASMAVFSGKKRQWSDDDIALVQETADRTWVALGRARADAELRERERQLVSLVNGVPAAIALTDATGAVTLANAAFKALVPTVFPSRDRERISLWRAWDEDGRSVGPSEFPGARALRGERIMPGIEMLYGTGASAVWKQVTSVPILDERGTVTGTVSAIADIDALKRSQQALRESETRFRQFGAASSDVLWIRNAHTLRWEYLSPAFETVYGGSVAEVMASENLGSWLDFMVREDREHAEASIKRVGAGEHLTFEYRIRRPDGQLRWIRDTDFPMRGADGTVNRIGGIGQDVTEQKGVSHRMEVMVAELQHRTRNLIAVVRSIARQTMSHTGPTGAFREELDHRLAALARVQGLLSRSDEEPITIAALVRMELDALGLHDRDAARVAMSGPPVRLRSTMVQTLALAVHELATNARKYGALSRDDGHLDVTWSLERLEGRGASLHLEWIEHGVEIAPGNTPQRRGYGRELIEQALPYSLGADVTYELGPEGVRCVIDLPLDKGKKPG